MSKSRDLADVVGQGLFYNPVTYVATEGQTSFPASYKVGHVTVDLNGITLPPDDYDASSGTAIVLNAAVDAEDIVSIKGHSAYAVADAVSSEAVDLKIGAINHPVTSVNGQTGDVTVVSGVTSVNGQSGAVTIDVPAPPVSSVNGQTGNVTIEIPSSPVPCKTYRQTWTGNTSVGSGNAIHVHTFPVQTIQAGKNLEVYFRVPARNDSSSWGGLYLNINCRVNGGTWYNFGNGGYDGNVMEHGASISTSHRSFLLDFIANAGVAPDADYTVQFELYARSYDGTTQVGSGSHDINRTANNLGVRGGLATWGSDQNFTTVIMREVDR